MRRREVIAKFRDEIDNYIKAKVGDPDFHVSPRERSLWCLNDAYLYHWINDAVEADRRARRSS